MEEIKDDIARLFDTDLDERPIMLGQIVGKALTIIEDLSTDREQTAARLDQTKDYLHVLENSVNQLKEALKHNNEIVEKIAGRLTEDIQVYIRDRVHMFKELDELKLRVKLLDGGFPEEKKKVEVVDETHSNE